MNAQRTAGCKTGGWNKTGCMSFLNQPILCHADEIRSAVLVMHGEKARSCYFSKDAFEKLTGDTSHPGRRAHTGLYDGGGKGAIPFDKLEDFFHANLR